MKFEHTKQITAALDGVSIEPIPTPAGVPVLSIEAALRLLHEPGEVFEVRIPRTERSATVSGYFNDPAIAAAAISKWDHKAPGIYVTLNPCVPALLARAENRLKERAKDATGDNDIARRYWLLIDVDFRRPTGISATNEELKSAGKLARRVKEYLEGECGWPAGVLVMSGNGAHLLYRLDLPNDMASRDLVKRVLEALAAHFDEPAGAGIDTMVFNASRIVKVPGTWACKGDDVEERPHRQSQVLDWPKEMQPVSLSALVAIGGSPAPRKAKEPWGGNGHGEFDVESFLQRHGLRVRKHKQDHGSELWELADCPFNPEHDHGEAFVRRDADGTLSAGCHHATCTLKTWADLRERFEPGYKDRRVAAVKVAASGPDLQPPVVDAKSPASHNCTDTGNSERVIDYCGNRSRYCALDKCWYIYDGKRWALDDTLRIEDLAGEALRGIYEEAHDAASPDSRKKLGEWAVASEAAAKRRAAVELARSARRVAVRPTEFDRGPDDLNCLSGTIDLRSGKLRLHDSADMISMLAPALYDPNARSELWERVLLEACGGDHEYVAYLQRFYGYAVSGATSEEIIAIQAGPTPTAKTTVNEAIKATLGDYAATVDPSTMIKQKNSSATRDNLLQLNGKRLAVSAEASRDARFDVSFLKMFTGEHTMKKRGLYTKDREFHPTAKLILHTNDVPELPDDDAVWRRVHVQPFTHRPACINTTFKPTLRDITVSGPAILAWLVKGHMAWREQGLNEPQVVREASAALRVEMNPLYDFFAQCCSFESGLWCSRSEVRKAYMEWCKAGNTRQPISAKEFTARVRAAGASDEDGTEGGRGVKGWSGISLKGYSA